MENKELQYLVRAKRKYRQFPDWLKMANISRQTFWKWETGKVSPGYNLLKKLHAIVKEQIDLQR